MRKVTKNQNRSKNVENFLKMRNNGFFVIVSNRAWEVRVNKNKKKPKG